MFTSVGIHLDEGTKVMFSDIRELRGADGPLGYSRILAIMQSEQLILEITFYSQTAERLQFKLGPQ